MAAADPASRPAHGADPLAWTGATPPAMLAGRVRALREAEDDAQAILAFVRNGLAVRGIDPAHTLWVIDLAPADGERAWRVLGTLSAHAPRGPAIRYLAACLDAAQHAALSSHPALHPLVCDGRLTLDRDGRALPAHPLRNPVVVLAHEACSARPQGLYAARAGALLEARRDGRGALDWRPTAVRDGPWRLLAAYRDCDEDILFTLPHGAMRLLSDLFAASGGRLLLRASDLGAFDFARIRAGALGRKPDAASAAPPPVNFEALARWHLANGGSAHQSQRGDDGRVLHVAVHDAPGGRLQECLPDVLALPHPDDRAHVLAALDAAAALTPAQCLALLRAQHGDSRAVRALATRIAPRLAALSGAAHGQWRHMLAHCRAQYYPRCDDTAADHEMRMLIASLALALEERPPIRTLRGAVDFCVAHLRITREQETPGSEDAPR